MTAARTIHRKPHVKKSWLLFFMALPLMALVFIFCYIPLFGWALAFVDYSPGAPLLSNPFVGLKFFRMILSSKDIPRVFTNTITFSGIGFCLLPLPMLLAILLNEIRSTRFRKVAQTLTTIPHFVSWVIVYSLAFSIFSGDGLMNQALSILGMKQQRVLQDAKAVYWFQTSISIWKSLGWNAIIYIAAITGIDQELYEAATVDGAGRLRCAWHITVPGLMPTFMVLALLAIANFVNQGVEQYYVFQNPVVMRNIEVLELFTYRVGLQKQDYSYATAVGMLKSLISLTMLFVMNSVARRIRGESIV